MSKQAAANLKGGVAVITAQFAQQRAAHLSALATPSLPAETLAALGVGGAMGGGDA